MRVLTLPMLAALAPVLPAAGAPVAQRWTPAAIASDQYESSPSFSPDGRELYFMRADSRFGNYRLLWSRCGPEGWGAPEPVPFAAPAPVLEADPFVSADGRRLYYVSARHDPNNADLDIWMVERGDDPAWGAPERLPDPVNSSSAELLPRETADGQLVFGSSRAGGHGQGDIYVATPQADGSWRVENMGPPINTGANEYEAEISLDGRTMVVVADRGDRSHLYHYTLQEGQWTEQGRVPAYDHVFQVGPLLSPDGSRLLFAQADGDRSGEIFMVDLLPEPMLHWPPACNVPNAPARNHTAARE